MGLGWSGCVCVGMKDGVICQSENETETKGEETEEERK